MATGVYNGFKGDLRDKSGQFVDLLIRDGYLPAPTKCFMCGQTEGRIVYHLEDYTNVLDVSMPMCFHCHMVLHCCRRGTNDYRSEERKEYWEMYKQACANGYCKRLYDPRRLFEAIDRGELL